MANPLFDNALSRSGTHSLKHDGVKGVFGTDDILPMWVADMDFASPREVTQALIERAKHPIYGYTLFPESTFEALRQWLSRRHRWEIARDSILLTPGVLISLHATITALTSAGDGIIIQPPIYPPFNTLISRANRRIIENPLLLVDGQYRMDFEHLENCAAQAKMLLLCSPHNPVGRVWTAEELTTLLEIAERHHLIVLVDEIHADLVYPEVKHSVIAKLAINPDSVITVMSPSKTFNIPGLGMAAIVAFDPKQRTRIQKTFNTLHAHIANPFSIAAFEAAYTFGDEWLNQLIAYLCKTRDESIRFINADIPQIQPIVPEGTYLLWLNCNDLGLEATALNDFMTQQAKVGMSSGITFGQEGSGFMRLNFGTPRNNVMMALEQIKTAINKK